MQFSKFIQSIFDSFNIVLENITKLFNYFLTDNFIKLIIFIAIFTLIISWLGDLIGLVYNAISQKKEASKNKVSSTRDIE